MVKRSYPYVVSKDFVRLWSSNKRGGCCSQRGRQPFSAWMRPMCTSWAGKGVGEHGRLALTQKARSIKYAVSYHCLNKNAKLCTTFELFEKTGKWCCKWTWQPDNFPFWECVLKVFSILRIVLSVSLQGWQKDEKQPYFLSFCS